MPSYAVVAFGFWLISAATPSPSWLDSPGWIEGQNVTAVSLIANPHRDLAPFFPLVTQGSNTPYSQEKIQASADALKKAGNQGSSRGSVPDITGLRVSFLRALLLPWGPAVPGSGQAFLGYPFVAGREPF